MLVSENVAVGRAAKKYSGSSSPIKRATSATQENSPSALSSDTSINIFRSFLQKSPKNGKITSALGVISKECYELWLKTRKFPSKLPEKAFQRALSGHVCGVDGRVPFSQEEEVEILKVLRRKQRWECFTNSKCKFGESGFRSKGFHEKLVLGEIQSTNPKKRSKKIIKKIHDIQAEAEEVVESEGENDGTIIKRQKLLARKVRSQVKKGEEYEQEEVEVTSQKLRTSGRDEFFNEKRIKIEEEEEEQVTTVVNSSSSSSSSSPDSSEVEEEEYENEDEEDFNVEDKVQLASSFGFQLPILRTLDGVRTSTVWQTMRIAGLAPLIITQVAQMITRLDARNIPWVEGLYKASIAMVASRGDCDRAPRDRTKLLALLDRMSASFPGHSVLLIDVSCTSYRDRIAEQNDISREIFGKISRHDGGNDAQRFAAVDILKVLRGFTRSYIFNEISSFQARYKCQPNEQLKLCEITHIWDSEHCVFVECAKLLE
jgi:hypothetical protein